MPLPPPFPIRIDDLTADFLSRALGASVAGIAAEQIGADRGMLGEIFHLRLDMGEASPGRELVAKFAALREGSLASALRGRSHERELLCYEQLLAETPARTPTCHGAWYDPATAHFLLLQDLVATDEAVDQTRGLQRDDASRVVSEIARLHSRWWNDSGLTELDWLPRLDGELRIGNLTTLARLGWGQLVALLGDELPDVPAGFGDALPSRIEAALRSIASLPHTLLHCDLRADNLLFDPVDRCATIIDWQGCGIGPGAFDMAYFVVQSLSIDDRRSHEAGLLAQWRDELAAAGVDAPGATAGYAESLWYGMAIACALPIVSDPDEPRVRELAQAVTSRTIAALQDHGQLDA